jgi:hypothetical protein
MITLNEGKKKQTPIVQCECMTMILTAVPGRQQAASRQGTGDRQGKVVHSQGRELWKIVSFKEIEPILICLPT